ncbi:hypothetical protein H5410_037671 [Solanum commersonii]|uniref:Uncharacterized protein n=1 Tax=Solanum commersonii TaxID=4109 RepID=A0A9J5Y943_SOLCO|nr:hypothetical protein H5410_037671 [Solanum commersonii]
MRYYHDKNLNSKSRNPLYEGGEITEIFDVDMNKMPPRSDFLLDTQTDGDIFEYSQSFKDGDIIEVYVCHMVDQVDVPIDFLEYTPINEKSFGAFNKEGDKGIM